MTKLPKFIKGILFSILAVGVFTLNISPVLETGTLNDYQLTAGHETFAQDSPGDKELDKLLNEALGDQKAPSEEKVFKEADAALKKQFGNSGGSGNSQGTAGGSQNQSGTSNQGTGTSNQGAGTGTSNNTNSPNELKLPKETIDKISAQAQIVFKIFDPAIYFFTKHISNLMGTDLIYGEGMGKMLQKIWVINRNIVNIAFVLILLFMALKYIFSSDENTDLKKLLPTFALALIAVNFTWLGSKLIIDAANVATNVVFAIPKGVSDTTGIVDNATCTIKNGTVSNGCSLTDLYYPVKSVKDQHMLANDCKSKLVADRYRKAYGDLGGGVDKDSVYYNTATYCWENLRLAKFDSTNAAYHLTYSMARVQNLARSEKGERIPNLAIKHVFAFIIMLIYLLTFLALFLALVFRVAFLWILVSFSPFIVLMMFLGKIGYTGGEELKKYISLKSFTDWAFAPALVAAVWAVGFIMISAGQLSTENIFAKFEGQSTVKTGAYQVSSLFSGIETIQELMWLIMTIMIIWMGTFAVLKKLEVVGNLLDKIGQKGVAAATYVAKIPTVAPIIPVVDPNTGKTTRMSLSKGEEMFKKTIKSYVEGDGGIDTKRHEEIAKYYTKSDAGKLNKAGDANDAKAAYGEFKRMSKASDVEIKSMGKEKLEKLLLDHKDMSTNQASKLAGLIHGHAQGSAVPATAPVPTNVTPLTGNALAKEVETGVTDAIRKNELNTKIKNFDQAAFTKDINAQIKGKHGTSASPNDIKRIINDETKKRLDEAGKAASTPPPKKTETAQKTETDTGGSAQQAGGGSAQAGDSNT